MWKELPSLLPFSITATSKTAVVTKPRRDPARRVTERSQRRLVSCLRRTVAHADAPPAPLRFQFLIPMDRVAAVHTDLLDIAARLEKNSDPDPFVVETLWRLLTDGCESPLLNRDIHQSELITTLYYAKKWLSADCDLSAEEMSGA